ncbi:hypothetical protein ABF190_002371, partial [Flavobacterium psychrophilum]
YYQKTVSVRNKTIQEIKTEIQKRWIESPVFYEFTFLKEREINNWEEKKIFNKLYNQTNEKEIIYSINRKYINKKDFEKENNISEIREKLNTFIDAIYSNQSFKNEENTKKFAAFDVDLERFCFWFNADRQYIFPDDENYTKEIVQFYKNNSRQLAKNYKAKIEDKALTNEELSLNLNEIKLNYQMIITQTLDKIKIRKRFVDLAKKNKEVEKIYDLYPKRVSKTYKKEELYFTYLNLYDSVTSKDITEDTIVDEMLAIQRKMIQIVDQNTGKLERIIKKENDEKLVAKAILDFQVQ